MDNTHHIFITFGGFLIFGAIAYMVGRKTAIPHVTILILSGIFLGPVGIDFLPEGRGTWHPLVSLIALMFVGFILGGRLSLTLIKTHGKEIFFVSIAKVLGTATLVFCGLMLFGAPIQIALLLAGIAPATAPAAVKSVVQETKAKGPFTDTLLGVVAIDDAWGLILFSIFMAIASSAGLGDSHSGLITQALWDIMGAIIIGAALGVPASFMVHHLRGGEPMEAEAIGFIMLCGGIALWLHVSYLLAVMTLGIIIINMSGEKKPFWIIESVSWPFMILFFILSGASLKLESLQLSSGIVITYVLCRSLGLIAGAWVGGFLSNMPLQKRTWFGLATQPQAGVALGMALIASQSFPDLKDTILPITIGSTILYEIFGPLGTRLALTKVGETSKT